MDRSVSRDPFLILKDIEQRSRRYALGLPQQQQVRERWMGIGFRLGQSRLVAPVDHVSEMIRPPTLTNVPGVKQWVRGIANIRGHLVPVIDVQGCLGGAIAKITKRSRVLIVQHEGFPTGLLVDEILGLKHFYEQERLAETKDADAYLADVLDGGFHQEGLQWGVMNIGKVAASRQFLQVA